MSSNERRLWTREETIIVLNLYCKIPFNASSKSHPEVIRIADIIGRTPSAVNMKIGNFGRLDNTLKAQNITGLTNGSKLDEQIWNEFQSNPSKLAYESELLINQRLAAESHILENEMPLGKEKIVSVKQRVNQTFFRSAVLSSYYGNCCICGISNPELLIASHIKPWSVSTEDERTNPSNGLCLSALYDRAFDKGFITVDEKYRIRVSKDLRDVMNGESIDRFFTCYDGATIRLPDKFLPQKQFLEYHNAEVFENWK